ncbi:uncharacterized protein [Dysidea avara]|uniref:uncharacterized protein n=1 Tax=Dysidea avara TaxID=196820 RepID=UPI0033308756
MCDRDDSSSEEDLPAAKLFSAGVTRSHLGSHKSNLQQLLSSQSEEDSDAELGNEAKRCKLVYDDSDSGSSSDVIITSVESQQSEQEFSGVLTRKVKVIDTSKSPVKVKPALKHSSKISMLHNIKELPVYAQPSNIMPTEECVTVLLSNLQESAICSRVPFACGYKCYFCCRSE